MTDGGQEPLRALYLHSSCSTGIARRPFGDAGFRGDGVRPASRVPMVRQCAPDFARLLDELFWRGCHLRSYKTGDGCEAVAAQNAYSTTVGWMDAIALSAQKDACTRGPSRQRIPGDAQLFQAGNANAAMSAIANASRQVPSNGYLTSDGEGWVRALRPWATPVHSPRSLPMRSPPTMRSGQAGIAARLPRAQRRVRNRRAGRRLSLRRWSRLGL
jgi:hypothetical protein